MARELTKEETCTVGGNNGRRHIGERECHYCGAKRIRRRYSKDAGTRVTQDYTQSDWRQLDRGVRILPGESRQCGGYTIKNDHAFPIWLEKVAYYCEDLLPKEQSEKEEKAP